jgi:MYXO-CTERM domain-containing protein
MRAARGLALLLLCAATGAPAALCEGPCTFAIDFTSGGSITSGAGATLTFGAGGDLTLGTGGTLTLGTGGSLTPNVDPPDMSAGGTLVLGPGGAIQFGTGGSLGGGTDGNIDVIEGGDLVVGGAASVTVDSAQNLHFGDLNAGGTASVTADTIDGTDTSTDIHLDTTGDITVTSDADVTFSSVSGASVVLTATAAASPGGFGDCSSGCPAGTPSTIGNPNIPTESGFLTSPNPGGGAPGLLTLVALALAGLLRRR